MTSYDYLQYYWLCKNSCREREIVARYRNPSYAAHTQPKPSRTHTVSFPDHLPGPRAERGNGGNSLVLSPCNPRLNIVFFTHSGTHMITAQLSVGTKLVELVSLGEL